MVRAHIELNGINEATEFVRIMNSDGTAEKYVLTDSKMQNRVSARSLLGVLYAIQEFDTIYLVNETEDGKIPYQLDKFRKMD